MPVELSSMPPQKVDDKQAKEGDDYLSNYEAAKESQKLVVSLLKDISKTVAKKDLDEMLREINLTIGEIQQSHELSKLTLMEPPNRVQEAKKTSYISWNEYFMSVAQLAARRSKDPCTQVGACIVDHQNKIVATGYNGMPNGVHDDQVPWTKSGSYLETKYAYVVHAELNAILNCVRTDQTKCRLYVSLFPCNECAKAIIQSGIRHVIYWSDKHKDKDATKAAKLMFKMAGVVSEQYHNLVDVNELMIDC